MPPNLQLSHNTAGLPNLSPAAAQLRYRDQRLHAMKELVSHLAHSFNNALAPMAGYITLLGEEIKNGTPSEHYLKKFENSLRKTQTLIEAVVQATHPEKQFLPKCTDLTGLLQRTVEAWMKALPASAQIAVHMDVTPCTLFLDELQWTKVIQHLLANAQFALTDGGALNVTLKARTLSAAQAAEVGLVEAVAWCLMFQDTGSGMAEDVVERAFDPLFTTRPNMPTTGLGLTYVHSVVQLHGGQLTLESRPDTGSTVSIWLPLQN